MLFPNDVYPQMSLFLTCLYTFVLFFFVFFLMLAHSRPRWLNHVSICWPPTTVILCGFHLRLVAWTKPATQSHRYPMVPWKKRGYNSTKASNDVSHTRHIICISLSDVNVSSIWNSIKNHLGNDYTNNSEKKLIY